MKRRFIESREAYSRGDGAAAKVLSKQGKIHKQEMEQLNKEASDWIYLENNRDRKPGEIDLHGLYVKEAIARTDTALEEAKGRGDSEIRIIVGKGLHSERGEARLGPAIKGLMRRYQLVAEFDPSNSGVLVVKLNGLTPIRHRRHHNISHRHGRRRASNIGA
ncbi:Smr-domain-containing protein [Armillaria borealis]|uniref:Smr-domain-containing protein n=1 Tax=Armillaria borealis TaxID=47425 RepID=A0AA39MEQ3_9AGAR|nr:Smr-domain-containing protein [Armillaria borealis]